MICLAMQSTKYCCTGNYANPNTCKPTLFAHLFKAICPKAYSYAFDDSSSHHFMPIQMSLEGAVMDWKVFSDKVVSVSSLIKDFVFELLVS